MDSSRVLSCDHQATAMVLLQEFARPLVHLSRYDGEQAVQSLMELPPKHFQSGWAQCQLGRAYFERADYKKVLWG